jgi:HK97 family phage prohead protease
MSIHKKTKEIDILTCRKDFKRFNLKRNFRFGASFKTFKSDEKASINTEKHTYIKGYASTDDADRVDDVITLDALQKSKDDLLQPGSKTVFYNHDKSMPIGKVVSTSLDDKGLIVEVQISNADDVKDIRTKIKEKVLNSFSIGGRFKKIQVERDDEGNVTSFKVLELELFEVSVVGIPCNPKATIFGVMEKSFKNFKDTSIKEKNMKKENKDKAEKGKETPVVKIVKPVSKATKKYIAKAIAEAIAPVSATLKTVGDALASMTEMVKSINVKKEKKDIKKNKKTKVEKNAPEMPEWAKTLTKQMEDIQSDLKSNTNKRKGYVSQDEEEETEEEVEQTEEIKKALKDADDKDTVKYVKHVMANPELYEKLEESEQEKANSIYFVLMDKSNRKDR